MSTNFIGANLPLFPMRKYDKIETIGFKKYIHTYYNKYILDDLALKGNYIERRLQLSVTIKKPDKLYPLGKICNTVQEIFNSKQDTFLDIEGNVLKWTKTAYYNVISLKVWKSNILDSGKVELFYKIPEGGLERVVTSKAYQYVYAVQLGAMCYMPLDFGDTFIKPCKKKL